MRKAGARYARISAYTGDMPGRVLGWGLWNPQLTEWFNQGGKRPYLPTKEAAHHMLPRAQREYPVGKWELREYRIEESEDDERQPDTAGATSQVG